MSRIEYSPLAKVDILQIGQYIAKESQNRATAYRFLDKLDERLKILARHPHGGYERPDLGDTVRSFPIGQYIIFYRPMKDGIQLIRLLHGSRDIPKVFWK